MNFKEFMQKVDNQLLTMTEKEKSAWIHEIARKQTEKQRGAFLDTLTNPFESSQQVLEQSIETKEIENWLLKIEEQKLYFECTYYEDYGENYWDRDEGYTYTDPFDIVPDLLKAFQTTEALLAAENYSKAAELYEWLCSIPFAAFDTESEDWLDGELDLEELVAEEMVNLDLKKIGLKLTYAQYQVTPMEKRPAVLFRYLSWEMCREIKIEEIFSAGPKEVADSDAFMQVWSTFLEKTPGDRAGELLTEACLYIGGIEYLCETAERTADVHPVLYENACFYLYDRQRLFECEKIGLKAIGHLPENLLIRGRIADIAENSAVELKHWESVRQFYVAAFYSNSTVLHYLRLFKLSDHSVITAEAAKFIQTLPEDFSWSGFNTNTQLNENSLSASRKNVIRFFNHEFTFIQETCKKNPNYLGWSSNFKGIIIPLFLLMMDKSEEPSRAKEIRIRDLEARLSNRNNGDEIFSDSIDLWKETVILTPREAENYLDWLNQEVEKRTEALVGGGYRKSYHKAAELIVLLGNAAESNGHVNEKKRLVEHYKKTYSRKRAFKEELDALD